MNNVTINQSFPIAVCSLDICICSISFVEPRSRILINRSISLPPLHLNLHHPFVVFQRFFLLLQLDGVIQGHLPDSHLPRNTTTITERSISIRMFLALTGLSLEQCRIGRFTVLLDVRALRNLRGYRRWRGFLRFWWNSWSLLSHHHHSGNACPVRAAIRKRTVLGRWWNVLNCLLRVTR